MLLYLPCILFICITFPLHLLAPSHPRPPFILLPPPLALHSPLCKFAPKSSYNLNMYVWVYDIHYWSSPKYEIRKNVEIGLNLTFWSFSHRINMDFSSSSNVKGEIRAHLWTLNRKNEQLSQVDPIFRHITVMPTHWTATSRLFQTVRSCAIF